ncbi:hypothetical protein MHPYR_170003 [uncultured Mycobacterium sp.]|uniref:Uncharacterized protein n=1 Tax=uncultured Mycobacterium sp. TaxID=171292 RepID=A0A1Y5P7W9_9MYCO|nr:hypothetical protein MHPYR_170003 [uncultured Mycobacterium sp.]
MPPRYRCALPQGYLYPDGNLILTSVKVENAVRRIHSPVSSAIEPGFLEIKAIDLKTYTRDNDTVLFGSSDDNRPDDKPDGDTPKKRGRRPQPQLED